MLSMRVSGVPDPSVAKLAIPPWNVLLLTSTSRPPNQTIARSVRLDRKALSAVPVVTTWL